jgi:hypothetical protein
MSKPYISPPMLDGREGEPAVPAAPAVQIVPIDRAQLPADPFDMLTPAAPALSDDALRAMARETARSVFLAWESDDS